MGCFGTGCLAALAVFCGALGDAPSRGKSPAPSGAPRVPGEERAVRGCCSGLGCERMGALGTELEAAVAAQPRRAGGSAPREAAGRGCPVVLLCSTAAHLLKGLVTPVAAHKVHLRVMHPALPGTCGTVSR